MVFFFACFQSNFFHVCIFKSMHCFCSLKCENLQKWIATSHAVLFTKMPGLTALQATFQPWEEPPTRQPPNQSPAQLGTCGKVGETSCGHRAMGKKGLRSEAENSHRTATAARAAPQKGVESEAGLHRHSPDGQCARASLKGHGRPAVQKEAQTWTLHFKTRPASW